MVVWRTNESINDHDPGAYLLPAVTFYPTSLSLFVLNSLFKNLSARSFPTHILNPNIQPDLHRIDSFHRLRSGLSQCFHWLEQKDCLAPYESELARHYFSAREVKVDNGLDLLAFAPSTGLGRGCVSLELFL